MLKNIRNVTVFNVLAWIFPPIHVFLALYCGGGQNKGHEMLNFMSVTPLRIRTICVKEGGLTPSGAASGGQYRPEKLYGLFFHRSRTFLRLVAASCGW
ncbi:hypothetical protein SB719_17985 [Pantoea sp. SIMBA_079]|uniref:hypothetical protein n=1 Tax=Pantoea sp. SIMBA_079 TaxID=3085817 RepID=UPI003995A1F3